MKGTRSKTKGQQNLDEPKIEVLEKIRERSRDKEEKVDNSLSQEKNKILSEEFKITLKSQTKTLLENFVDQEIKKNYNKNDYHSNFRKVKNEFTFNITFNNRKFADELLEKIKRSENFLKSEIKVWFNDEEVELKTINQNQEISNTPSFEEKNLKFNSLEFPTKEISITNVPDKMNTDKIYEIFFIYGDISKIEFNKEQVRIS
jgi:hypothetical protein